MFSNTIEMVVGKYATIKKINIPYKFAKKKNDSTNVTLGGKFVLVLHATVWPFTNIHLLRIFKYFNISSV